MSRFPPGQHNHPPWHHQHHLVEATFHHMSLPLQKTLTLTHNAHHARRSHNQPHIIIKQYMASFATQITNIAVALHTDHTVIDTTTGSTFEHAQPIHGAESEEWLYSTANESRRLTKGTLLHMPYGTETMAYLRHDALPHRRKATDARFVTTERPHKTERSVRLTVVGNLIHYPDKFSTPSSELSIVEILLKSVISTPHARFTTFDLKDFLFGTPMARKEYMRIVITYIPHSIINQYHLLDLFHNGFVLVEISRGMYGLPQAGILAYNQLVAHLAKYGYAPITRASGIWTHDTRDVTFCLVLDDFGIKYTNRCDAEHHFTALQA
jgi:hypothetical protein